MSDVFDRIDATSKHLQEMASNSVIVSKELHEASIKALDDVIQENTKLRETVESLRQCAKFMLGHINKQKEGYKWPDDITRARRQRLEGEIAKAEELLANNHKTDS